MGLIGERSALLSLRGKDWLEHNFSLQETVVKGAPISRAPHYHASFPVLKAGITQSP